MDLMEILKTLFGGEALTFEQFAEKVNNAADVKLGNLAGGQYVEKDKYDDVSNQLASANANLGTCDRLKFSGFYFKRTAGISEHIFSVADILIQ